MRKNVYVISIICITVMLMASSVHVQERTGRGVQSLFGDVRASKIGDVVTVVVNENAQASNIANTQTQKQNQTSMEGDFGNFLSRLTGKIAANTQNQYSGSGQTTSQGRFLTTISARIIGITEDGNFLIRGSKEVETNGEKVTTVVSGIIRGEDISPNNTISSNMIADASIYHEGKGVVKQGNRPGIFTRIINWIF